MAQNELEKGIRMIRPLRDKIVVKENKEIKKDVFLANGSIYVPEKMNKEDFRKVEIVALGDAEWLVNSLKVGDTVLINTFCNAPSIIVSEGEFMILGFEDVYGVIE